MNIKIVDSWLREHLKTSAKTSEIAKILSLTSVSVERMEKHGEDTVYDIEVTTNRPELMSVIGIARESAAVLPEHEIDAKFTSFLLKEPMKSIQKFPIEIKFDPKIVNRICAVVMDIKVDKSPAKISDRLEKSGIRSLNNLIDVTNYVMRETGHPTHVFDFDRLNTKSLLISTSEKGDLITTLDGKNYTLLGDDIIAKDDNGRIIDLLGVMGTENSVVTNETRRILFFVDNIDPYKIRNTSMNLGIRTEAAVINEKGVDPELSMTALLTGIELFKEIANGKVTSEILDLYPNKPKEKTITVNLEKINSIIGIDIPIKKSKEILERLNFTVEISENSLEVIVPSERVNDVGIEEDIIEEIARVYGYHKLPSVVPTFLNNKPYKFDNSFYFENRIKQALKYLGFNEVYTYSMVSEEQLEGPVENALAIKNPLSEDMVYLRVSLTPSLLAVKNENKKEEVIKIFELANTYAKQKSDLPRETLTLSGIVKKPKNSFFEVKGVIESVLEDLGIKDLKYKQKDDGIGATVFRNSEMLGTIEVFDDLTITFEFNFEKLLSFANIKKTFKPLAKFPPIIEDLSLEIGDGVSTIDLINEIKGQSELIAEVSLLDQFGSKKTFHIIYQALDKNLTSGEVSKVRGKVIASLQNKFSAKVL